jgi:hypothetical protein
MSHIAPVSNRLISLYYSRQKIPDIKVWTLIAELYLGKNTDKFLREWEKRERDTTRVGGDEGLYSCSYSSDGAGDEGL